MCFQMLPKLSVAGDLSYAEFTASGRHDGRSRHTESAEMTYKMSTFSVRVETH